jgi:hypothetical protein
MSAPMPLPLLTGEPITMTGPLTIAELLDRTFRALRARFGVLVLSAAIVMVPLGVVTALISGRFMTGYFDLLQYSFTTPENVDFAVEEFFSNILGYLGAIVLLSILSLLGTTLVTLMSVHHVERFLHGETSTVAEGWRAAIRRILPMIGLQILEFVIIGVVTGIIAIGVGILLFIVALIFGGAMAGLGNETASIILGIGLIIVLLVGYLLLLVLLLAPTAYFMGRWVAAVPTLLIEGMGPVTALQRSWALTKGRVWRALIFIVLLTLISAIVIGLPVVFMQQIAIILMPSQLALITVISTSVSYLLNLFYQPFYATGIVLFYYDLRVRAEAYDVALRVAALEAELAPDAPPA